MPQIKHVEGYAATFDDRRCIVCGSEWSAHSPECSRHAYRPIRRVYLAARYSRREELCGYRELLRTIGVDVTSRWLDGGYPVGPDGLSAVAPRGERSRFALQDWEDILAADTVIAFTEEPRSNGRGGRHVEFGAALATHKRCLVVGPEENIFYTLPGVEVFEGWPALLGRYFPLVRVRPDADCGPEGAPAGHLIELQQLHSHHGNGNGNGEVAGG